MSTRYIAIGRVPIPRTRRGTFGIAKPSQASPNANCAVGTGHSHPTLTTPRSSGVSASLVIECISYLLAKN
ncbi:hypothetical protein KEM48_003920 [Puccinia striiformis f. sp. tritici PST-130]|nr:hypothetical protein KEM48_003920 [Puccinia striiformis f. sp. tritici PST-130]